LGLEVILPQAALLSMVIPDETERPAAKWFAARGQPRHGHAEVGVRVRPRAVGAGARRLGQAGLGFGRIAASDIGVPNMFVDMV
jgi:hypothetical protein